MTTPNETLAQPESEPGCRVCGSPLGSLHMAAGNLKCGWPARVQVSDCEPEGTQNVRTPASDREALIATLRDKYKWEWHDDSLKQAADMLEADAQQCDDLTIAYMAGHGKGVEDGIKRAQQVAVPQTLPTLSDDEHKSLLRFAETCEDGEGYDVPKLMMQRLAKIGVVGHVTAGIYAMTRFGEAVLKAAPQPAYVPLTDEDAIKSAIERHMADFPANCKNAATEVAHAVLAHKGEVK